MADIKLSIDEQRVLNDILKRLSENLGYTENALTTPLGDLLGGVRAPAPIRNVQVTIATCAFMDAHQIGDGHYDARWNAYNYQTGFVFGTASNGKSLTLAYDNTLPADVRWWAEFAPDYSGVTVHFSTGNGAPDPADINTVIGNLTSGDFIQQTHLAGGTPNVPAQFATWDSDPDGWRARAAGAAGNSLKAFEAYIP